LEFHTDYDVFYIKEKPMQICCINFFLSFLLMLFSLFEFSSSSIAAELDLAKQGGAEVGPLSALHLSCDYIDQEPTTTVGFNCAVVVEGDEGNLNASTVDPLPTLIGKYAFVTGITSGIGLELAKLLWREGVNVIGLGRNAEKLENVKQLNTQEKLTTEWFGNLYTITADLGIEEQQKSISPHVSEILGERAKLNFIAFNAAVITPLGYEAVFASPAEEIRRTLETNAMSPVLLTNMLFPFYAKQARLLYVSSIAGERPGGGTLLYSISKALIDQFVRALRKECGLRKASPLPPDCPINPWGEMDLLVAGVNPGNVETPIHSRDLRGVDPAAMPRVEFFQSMEGKLLTADKAAKYLDWLLTKSTPLQYLATEKHTIYDPQEWREWSPHPIIDPYPSTAALPAPSRDLGSPQPSPLNSPVPITSSSFRGPASPFPSVSPGVRMGKQEEESKG
jgi:NAD(P)-dependent dehydrogenase (short-subunit alcohol dehydrogenase family)